MHSTIKYALNSVKKNYVPNASKIIEFENWVDFLPLRSTLPIHCPEHRSTTHHLQLGTHEPNTLTQKFYNEVNKLNNPIAWLKMLFDNQLT